MEPSMLKTKFIFVTGGVASSLGKGIISSSIAKLLAARGYTVAIQKLDPYINIDPGTLNPYEHGECFVTDDGAETDLDLGHYERFTSIPTSQANNVTTGVIYQSVINKERKGLYLGETVQVIPHITDEIKHRIQLLAQEKELDFLITEIGGTVGDIESLPFIESVRQLRWDLGKQSLVVHLTLVPFLSAAAELKTKPTQHSVKMLQEQGVQPDIIVCRTEHHLNEGLRNKIALFCNVEPSSVIECIDAKTIYEVPMLMKKENLDLEILRKTKVKTKGEPDLESWKKFLYKLSHPVSEVHIGLVGKYVELKDAYKSILESFVHAGAENECKVHIRSVHSEYIDESNVKEKLKGLDRILVAPGFGERGIEGKIISIRYARENKIPFLGICLGMQCAVIEFGRNVLNLKDSPSPRFNRHPKNPVIDMMEEQKKISGLGGTMRLGAYACTLSKDSKLFDMYQTDEIQERHRHRYEFNNEYLTQYSQAGLVPVGINEKDNLVEIIELKDHPWFVGVQFHPEYKSTVATPHPLFVHFVRAAMNHAAGESNKKSE